jgi:UDP-glucose 4-epimerase
MKQIETFYKNKNVLVTGGAGFIGSHIARKLVSLGAHVSILDDLSTGCIDNIQPIIHKTRIKVGDICNKETCLQMTQQTDIIFHLAAFVSVPESMKHSAICERINYNGTKNLLVAAAENNVSTLIFSSSSAVYGEKKTKCTEKDSLSPQSPYAQSKLAGEQLCKEFSEKINTAALRYFNVYGERQNPNGSYAAVVAKFTEQLKKEEPLKVYGDGTQRRDFIHVSEVVAANILIGAEKQLQGEIFNIGSGKSINLLELIEQLKSEIKIAKPTIEFLPAREGDIHISEANCEKYLQLKQKVLT